MKFTNVSLFIAGTTQIRQAIADGPAVVPGTAQDSTMDRSLKAKAGGKNRRKKDSPCKLPKFNSNMDGEPYWVQTGQVMTFFDATDSPRKTYTDEGPTIQDNDQYIVQCREKGYIPDEACFYTCKDGVLDDTTYCSARPKDICVPVRESTFSKQCPLDFDSDKPFYEGKSLKQWWKEVLDKYHFQREELFALETDIPIYLGHGAALLAGFGFTAQHFVFPSAAKEFNADAVEITGWISGEEYEYGEDTLRGSTTVEGHGFVQDLVTEDVDLGVGFMLPNVTSPINEDFVPKLKTTALLRDYDPCDDSKYLGFGPECFIYHPAGYHLGSGEMIMFRSPLSNGNIDLQGVCTGAETIPPITVPALLANLPNITEKVEKAGGFTGLHPAAWSMHLCIDDDDIYHPYLCSDNVDLPSVEDGDYVPVDAVPFIPIPTKMRKQLCAIRKAAGPDVCKPTTDTESPYPWTQNL